MQQVTVKKLPVYKNKKVKYICDVIYYAKQKIYCKVDTIYCKVDIIYFSSSTIPSCEVDHRLKCGRCEGVTAETKFLYYHLVAQPKRQQHGFNLESRVNPDAPHLQRCKETGEVRLQIYHLFVCQLPDGD